MNRKDKALAVAVKILAAAFAVAFFFVFNSAALKILGELALLSAKSYLPSGKVSLFETTEAFPKAATTIPATSTYFPDTAATTKPLQSLSASCEMTGLTGLDEDIAALIKKAEAQSSSDKKDGDIFEYTFTDDGVTDFFGNVRVKNVNETGINIEEKLNESLELEGGKDEPLVLIYHTHTTETYQLLDRDFYAEGFITRSNDENLNMIRVGKAVKEELESLGYKVIHDTTIYDNPYSGAYYRSMDGAVEILKKYPSVKITLDLHRDAIQNDTGVKTKPTAVINGKKAAQIMIISGCQEEGNGITDLPEWEKNLTFALKLQQSMESLFPGLTRPLYFCPRSYNMSLTPMSLLVEMGTDANTLDEAVYSGKLLARALGKLIEENS